jgi:glucan phosphorylase
MPTRKFILSKPKSSIIKIPQQGMKKKDFIEDFKQYYVHLLGRDEYCHSPYYASEALSLVLRERLMERWKNTHNAYKEADSRRLFYLSMEYLMGRALNNAMLNLGVEDTLSEAMHDLGIEIEELIDSELDAGLGNGGLGRLAACFIDSCATLQLPVLAYGLRYEYGMFTQKIVNGEQVEKPDHWLRHGNVWEIARLEYCSPCRLICRFRVIAITRSILYAYGKRWQLKNSTSTNSTRVITLKRLRPKPLPKISRWCCIPMTIMKTAKNYGCANNIFSPLPACKTYSPIGSDDMATTSANLPRKIAFNSTTRIRASPLPNSCGYYWIYTVYHGATHGQSPVTPWHTPITRCCPKP